MTDIAAYAYYQYLKECPTGPCELLTGRTHQIRAQFSHAGHPLVGDGKYGRDRDGEGQQLCSYKLVFSFKTDAGALNYLLNKEFTVETPNFASFFGFSI